MKKLLTIESLIKFCKKSNFTRFSANEQGYQLCVQVPTTYEKKDIDNDLLLFLGVLVLHDKDNLNGTNVTFESAEACMEGIKYKPILAAFKEVEDEDGNKVLDFMGHEIEEDEDDDSIVYIEQQVGAFTADDPTMIYNEENGKNYIYATAAIPKDYTKASEIIERRGGCSGSVELLVNEMRFDAESNSIFLDKFEVMGYTLLGEDVLPGMEGAGVSILDFSQENNSLTCSSADLNIKEILEKFDKRLSKIENSGKEENSVSKLEELLNQYGKTETDLTFEVEGLSDEELENKFKEVFTTEPENSEPETEPEPEPTTENYTITYSVLNGDKVLHTYSLTLSEKLEELSRLVYDAYSCVDDEYYRVDADEDNHMLYMYGYNNNYRQSYRERNGVFSLVGERIPIEAVWMSADEKARYQRMMDTYPSMFEKLEKYESEPEKIKILESKDYENISDTDEFKNLKNRETYFNLSVEEVQSKADSILLEYAKRHKIESKPEPEKTKQSFAFSKHVTEKDDFLSTLNAKIKKN